MLKYIKSGRLFLRLAIASVLFSAFPALAQIPPSFTSGMRETAEADQLKRIYLTPQRIVWKSSDSLVVNAELLLEKGNSQAFFENRRVCRIINKGKEVSGLILDFGKEIQGGIQITTSQSNRVTRKVRLRFGESVSEACGETLDEPIGEDGSTNHHAMRDFQLVLPGYGTLEIGNTGFRFVRIDFLEPDAYLALKEIRAVASFRDVNYLGSFKSSDEKLNKIWETGAYTVHLNMQNYLLDGIKRDRMVWAGDMHPEIMTINHVFGYNEVVPKSLDFLKANTPVPKFMNGIPSYSMWWVIMQHDWYQFHGRREYLEQQKDYLIPLLDLFTQYVDEQGREKLQGIGFRFIDWPSANNPKAVHAGLQAMLLNAFEKGASLCKILGENEKAEIYLKTVARMRKYVPDHGNSKQAAALLSLTSIVDAQKANQQVIAVGGARKFSSFFGYYMLQAQAKAGDYEGALNNIRAFWGRMLDLGATTFWEEFDIEEAANASRIDELVPEGKFDYHACTGTECYIGLRRSLCHGWASGPTAWLSEHVLGIKVLEPGCKKIRIEPHLGDLTWAEGTFPTPMGVLYVKHTKLKNGKIESVIKAPDNIKVIR